MQADLFKTDRDKAFCAQIEFGLSRLREQLNADERDETKTYAAFMYILKFLVCWIGSRCGEVLTAHDFIGILPSNALEIEFKDSIERKLNQIQDDDIPF